MLLIAEAAGLIAPTAPTSRSTCIVGEERRQVDFLLRHLKETSKHVRKPNELMHSDAVIHFEVGTAHFVVDLTGLVPAVISCHGNQCPSDGDVWVSVTPADLRALLERRLSLMTAVMQKRLRLTGNTSVLHSMGWLWESWRIHAPVANST